MHKEAEMKIREHESWATLSFSRVNYVPELLLLGQAQTLYKRLLKETRSIAKKVARGELDPGSAFRDSKFLDVGRLEVKLRYVRARISKTQKLEDSLHVVEFYWWYVIISVVSFRFFPPAPGYRGRRN